MLSFKQFLKEAPVLNDITKEPGLSPYREDNPTRKYISNLMGHKVSIEEKGPFLHYGLHEPKTDKISLGLTARKHNGKTHVENLNGFGNKVPAHDFYHHLITEHGVHLHSDTSLSKGALNVWNKLHKMPGIRMQTYNMITRNYEDIPKNKSLNDFMNRPSTIFAAKKI